MIMNPNNHLRNPYVGIYVMSVIICFLGVVVFMNYDIVYDNPSQDDDLLQYRCLIVEGDSLHGIIESGDYVWSKIYTPGQDMVIERDDIVLVNQSGSANLIIKRIVGLPGDSLILSSAEKYLGDRAQNDGSFLLEINGSPLSLLDGTFFVFPDSKRQLFSLYEGKIMDHMYLILGNQQGGTYDSSRFGPVPEQNIVAKVIEHSSDPQFCKNKKTL